MLKLDCVKATKSKEEEMLEFYKVSLTNQEPDYDIGLEKPPPPPPAETTAAEESVEKAAE
jgi:hypothetical protein